MKHVYQTNEMTQCHTKSHEIKAHLKVPSRTQGGPKPSQYKHNSSH